MLYKVFFICKRGQGYTVVEANSKEEATVKSIHMSLWDTEIFTKTSVKKSVRTAEKGENYNA